MNIAIAEHRNREGNFKKSNYGDNVTKNQKETIDIMRTYIQENLTFIKHITARETSEKHRT